MPIFLKGKTKYVTSVIDGTEHCLTNGRFAQYLTKLGMTIEEYVLKYEPPTKRLTCKCGKETHLHGNAENQWVFLKVCGNSKCAKEARAMGLRLMNEDTIKAKRLKTQATFAADPARKNAAIKACKEGNLKIGVDGLTGYERSKIERGKTLLEKYGRSDYSGWEKAKETCKNRTDERRAEVGNHISLGQRNISIVKRQLIIRKANETCILRNGRPAWKIAYDSSMGRRSIIADDFCRAIQNDISDPLFFGLIEFSLKNENGTKYYDLVNSRNKRIIEFNGDYWHANPKKYSSGVQLRNGSSDEIWEVDAKKIALAEAHGYEVKVVWESDYKRNPAKIIEECKRWLNS